jgi:hypothetical protein
MKQQEPPAAAPKKPITELGAMARIVRTLEQQSEAARRRIMAYLTSLFDPPVGKMPEQNGPDPRD